MKIKGVRGETGKAKARSNPEAVDKIYLVIASRLRLILRQKIPETVIQAPINHHNGRCPHNGISNILHDVHATRHRPMNNNDPLNLSSTKQIDQ